MSSPRKQKSIIQSVKPGDIFYLDQPRLRGSDYPHYCVVLRIDGNSAYVNFLSSQIDCFNENKGDIILKKSDEEFWTTGLVKDTFLINRDYARDYVPIENLFALRGKIGYVSGEFKKRIEDFWGESLDITT